MKTMRNSTTLLTLNIALVFCFLIPSTTLLAAIDIAITVDDLPSHGDLPTDTNRVRIAEKMIKAFDNHQIKGVYGFINAKKVAESPETLKVLKKWVTSGNLLGNHTYSHPDLVKATLSSYLDDIRADEPLLSNVMGPLDFRFFRYPFLAEGNTQEKRDGVRKFLSESNYKIAEVTMDFFDYEWANPYVRCLKKNDQKSIAWLKRSFIEQALNGMEIAQILSKLLFARDIKYILLTHVGAFQAEMMDDLITAFQSKGARFVSLPEALADNAYQINPNVIRDRTYTFLSQVRVSRGLKNPPRAEELYSALPEEKLASICK